MAAEEVWDVEGRVIPARDKRRVSKKQTRDRTRERNVFINIYCVIDINHNN